MNDELALLIGRHVLEQYNAWTENPVGKKVVMSILFPHPNNEPAWAMDIECGMPWFIEEYYEKGKRRTKHWSLKEWYLKHKK